MRNIFVYGTLKKGYGNHRVMQNAEGVFVQEDTLQGYDIYDLGGIPGVIEGEGEVTGEVFSVSDEGLPYLDRLEGHPTFYKRSEATTLGGIPVEVYIIQRDMSRCTKLNGSWPKVA